MTNKMNQAVSTSYNEFVVIYHEVNQKIWIGNKTESFVLNFDKRENYYDSDLSMLSYFWLTVCCILSTISNPSSPASSLFVVLMSSPSSI